MITTTDHPFDIDTAVERRADGGFAADLSSRWDRLGGGPLGGYSLAVALRALSAEMTHPDLLVVSTHFLRPATHGPAEVLTELIRSGRSVSTGEARLVQDGREVLRLLATHTNLDDLVGPTSLYAGPPSLPDPDHCVDPLEGLRMEGVSIIDRVEYRFPEMPGWARGEPTGRPQTECWIRFKEPRDADLLSLPLLADAVAPVVMETGAAGSSTLELTVHLRGRPAPGWLACRISTRFVIDGYHEEDFEIWDRAGRLVAQSRQLARLPVA
jgi:acyl-CoA thioesterase